MDPTKNWAYVDFYYADLHLPETSGIYLVFAARAGRDICIYVGQAKDLKARWARGHHKALACLREGADFIRFQPTLQENLDEEELKYIKHFEPALNVKGLGQSVPTSSPPE